MQSEKVVADDKKEERKRDVELSRKFKKQNRGQFLAFCRSLDHLAEEDLKYIHDALIGMGLADIPQKRRRRRSK